MSRIPTPTIRVVESQTTISELVGTRNGYRAGDYSWAVRFLGKFPLPAWQRDSVWTLNQKVALIESAYLGYDLGSVVINEVKFLKGDRLAQFSDALIDGQQRVGAFLDYVNNEFKVFGFYWRELDRSEQKRFLYRQMGKRMVECFDEEKLKQVYNHLNFAGTQHKESERALIK